MEDGTAYTDACPRYPALFSIRAAWLSVRKGCRDDGFRNENACTRIHDEINARKVQTQAKTGIWRKKVDFAGVTFHI
jgi:hypothetical protein